MKVISLQSGSNGNCFYVETDHARLLFDAGISGRAAQTRLAEHGRDIGDVDAIFITHDHSDHIRSLNAFHNKFRLPVYITRPTLAAAQRSGKVSNLQNIVHFQAGETIVFGDEDVGTVRIHSIPTPHDSIDAVAYVVEDDTGRRVGILTDLGHVFDGLRDVLESLDAVIIESNYDPQMLELGRYPWGLKQRIRGDGGHLSNVESAELLSEHRSDRLQWACLCHLSGDNNCPDVARQTHQRLLGEDFPIHVASRKGASEVFEVGVRTISG